MNGLLPKIKEAMLNGVLQPDYDWDQATQAAIEAEKLLTARELSSSNGTVNTVIQQNAITELLQAQQKRIEQLEKQLKQLISTNKKLIHLLPFYTFVLALKILFHNYKH